jgi:hypothetical protein
MGVLSRVVWHITVHELGMIPRMHWSGSCTGWHGGVVMARVFRGVDDYEVNGWGTRVSGLSASCKFSLYI